MQSRYEILILGASYGSLLAAKLLLAGHSVRLVCLPAEAVLINAEGFRVRRNTLHPACASCSATSPSQGDRACRS